MRERDKEERFGGLFGPMRLLFSFCFCFDISTERGEKIEMVSLSFWSFLYL